MKKCYKDLKDITNFKKIKVLLLAEKENKSPRNKKLCYICRDKFINKEKSYWKVRNTCHYSGKYKSVGHVICNLRYKIKNKIAVIFHNVSNYDYHLTIKELAREFEEQLECLGKNTKKYLQRNNFQKVRHLHIK